MGIWLVIIFVGALTYLMRVLPFVSQSRLLQKASEAAWLERLGPAMLVAIMVSVVLPFSYEQFAAGMIRPLVFGLFAVVVIMTIKPNAGLATLGGILVYWLGM